MATSVEQWKQKGVHQATLTTGAEVSIRIPNLAQLVKHDAIPESLRAAALREISTDGMHDHATLTREEVGALYQLYEFLVVEMLVDPKLAPPVFEMHPKEEGSEELVEVCVDRGDVEHLPAEDLDLLIALATRQRNTDALGRVLGVMPLSRLATFREEHGCDPGCEACARVQQRLSLTG